EASVLAALAADRLSGQRDGGGADGRLQRDRRSRREGAPENQREHLAFEAHGLALTARRQHDLRAHRPFPIAARASLRSTSRLSSSRLSPSLRPLPRPSSTFA